MPNIMYIHKGGGGIFRKGKLGPIGQGTIGIDMLIEIRDLDDSVVDLTGYSTITGQMEKQDTEVVTAIDGTRTLVDTGATGRLTWVVSANDSGTDGLFWVVFSLTNGTDTYVTLPAEMLITDNPTQTASANNQLVGILQATSTWLTAEKTATEAAADGEILQSDGTNSEGSGYLTATSLRKNNYTAVTAPGVGDDTGDGYAPGSRWIDTVGDESYTCVDATLGAAVWKSATAAAGIGSLVEDTTPQLGGDLDLNGNVITGMVIGTDVQAFDAGLSDLAGLAVTDGNIPVGNGTNWVAESGATARASLGAGDTAEYIIIPASDETTNLTTGLAKVTFRMPYAMTLTEVRANVNTAPVGSAIQVDINKTSGTILSTKITIDAGDETSEDATTPPIISDTALADDAELIIDIDAVGSSTAGKGLKVTLIGTRP